MHKHNHNHNLEMVQCVHQVGDDISVGFDEVDLGTTTPVNLWKCVKKSDGTPPDPGNIVLFKGVYKDLIAHNKFKWEVSDVGINSLILIGFENNHFVSYQSSIIHVVPKTT